MPLNDVKCKNLSPNDKTYKVADEKGLYLEITPKGGKYWRLKYRFAGKEKRLAFGVYPDVSLKEAREKMEIAKKQLANNIDPSIEKKLKKLQENINLDNSFGYYRVVKTNYLRVKIDFNTDNNTEPDEFSVIYLDKMPVGYFVSLSTYGDNTYMTVTSELDSAFEIGNRLNFGAKNIVVQVIDMTVLGDGVNIVLEYVKSLKIDALYESKPIQQGLFRLEVFRFLYPEDSILQNSNLDKLDTDSTVKSTNNSEYTTRGKIYTDKYNSSNITFSTRDLPETELGYQILRVQSENDYRDITDNNIIDLEVILTEMLPNGNLKVYVRDNDVDIYPGQWLKVVYQDAPQDYLQVKELDDTAYGESPNHGPTLILDNTNHDNSVNIMSIKIIEKDIVLSRGLKDDNVMGYLTDSCLRSQRNLPVITSSEFRSGYIIKIGNDIDGRGVSNSELNIISQIIENNREGPIGPEGPEGPGGPGDPEYQDAPIEHNLNLITKYPITNSRIEGTCISQLYPIYNFTSDLKRGATEITINSDENLTSSQPLMGCINWLSNYLADLGDTAAFLAEEPIFIKQIVKLDDYRYCLKLSKPIKYQYGRRETYLVLFTDIKDGKIRDISPTTINYNHDGEWYTGFRLEMDLNHERGIPTLPDKINIYGMNGDNIPIFGLSESDIATRGIQGLDIASNMEHLSDFLTAPNPDDILEVVGDIPEFFNQSEDLLQRYMIVVKGRYSGRGGQIRGLNQKAKLETDLSFANLIANKQSRSGEANCHNISKRVLPNSLQNDSSEVVITVTPINKRTCLDDKNYSYFYICCSELSNIQAVNGAIGNYLAHDGWTFLNNSNYPNEELHMRQNSMKHANLLNNIFAKIQVNTTNQHYSDGVIYNTYVPCTADFSDNPIREINHFDFVFLWPDGQLVDFECKNHSFTLEITERIGTLSTINPINGEIQQ